MGPVGAVFFVFFVVVFTYIDTNSSARDPNKKEEYEQRI